MVFGVLWSFHVCFNIRLASFFLAPIVSVHGRDCIICVSQSITLSILPNWLEVGKPAIKFWLMSIHGPAGIRCGPRCTQLLLGDCFDCLTWIITLNIYVHLGHWRKHEAVLDQWQHLCLSKVPGQLDIVSNFQDMCLVHVAVGNTKVVVVVIDPLICY